MYKDIISGDEYRAKAKAGIDKIADTVKITLGASGRNVLLDTNPYGSPLITNDGVTIARNLLNLPDKFENAGAKIVLEAASKTNDAAGDGTTTASVLVQAIVSEGLKAIATGTDPIQLRKGIEAAVKLVTECVRDEASTVEPNDIESLANIATISCGDATIGRLVAEMVAEVGAEGLVTLEDSIENLTSGKLTEGLEVRGGFTVQGVFVTNQATQEAIYEKGGSAGVPVFVTNMDLTNEAEMQKIAEVAHNGGRHKQIVIIANTIDGSALAFSVVNTLQKAFSILPIRVQAYGEMGEGLLRDVAETVGAKFFSPQEGHRLDQLTYEDFGLADKIVASNSKTTIIGGAGDKEGRVEALQGQLKNERDAFKRESLEERIAKLTAGVAVISVGGQTDTEREERKLRVEDAINATKAALQDGVVAGGGAALYRASASLYSSITESELLTADDTRGVLAIASAIQRPLYQIAENSSTRLDRTDLEAVQDLSNNTIDFRTGKVVDAFEEGIIDPVKVVVSALTNAASVSALFLTSEAGVVTIEDKTNG